jgi:hypothetical protein
MKKESVRRITAVTTQNACHGREIAAIIYDALMIIGSIVLILRESTTALRC